MTNVEYTLLHHFPIKIILRITNIGQQYIEIISLFDT